MPTIFVDIPYLLDDKEMSTTEKESRFCDQVREKLKKIRPRNCDWGCRMQDLYVELQPG